MIDPLDGTNDFVNNWNRYSVIIWLCINWNPVLWAVFCPVISNLYYAEKWKWAYFVNTEINNKPEKIHVSDIDLIEASNYFTKSKFSEQREINEKINKTFNFKNILEWWSVGTVLSEIARWIWECYILTNKRSCKWDSCWPQIILEEAWWKVTDIFWNPIDYLTNTKQIWNLLVATNWKIHDKIIQKTKEL